jgi:hypothetical protein
MSQLSLALLQKSNCQRLEQHPRRAKLLRDDLLMRSAVSFETSLLRKKEKKKI